MTNEEIENEMYRYVEGTDVSDEFLSKLKTDKALAAKVYRLKEDLSIMEGLDNSPLFIEDEKEESVKFSIISGVINVVENIGFAFLADATARGDESKMRLCGDELEIGSDGENRAIVTIFSVEKECAVRKGSEKVFYKSGKSKDIKVGPLKKGEYLFICDGRRINISIV